MASRKPDSVPRTVPILTYHSLDSSRSVVSVDPSVFSAQMRRLARRGFTGISLGQLLDSWQGGAKLPAQPVVITFDDGLENCFELGIPLLSELGFSATVFAVAGHLGQQNDWESSDSIKRRQLMSMAQLRELTGHGFEVGSHSMSHPRRTELSSQELARELQESRAVLEEGLGQAVRCFAYPYGDLNPEVVRRAGEHYSAACGVRLAPARKSGNLMDLPRLDMYYFRGGLSRGYLCTWSGAAYLTARRMGRWLRGRLVSSH